MQKLKMKATKNLTFKEGCERYLEYCRQRNLREGTINHYRQSFISILIFSNKSRLIYQCENLNKATKQIDVLLKNDSYVKNKSYFIFMKSIKKY